MHLNPLEGSVVHIDNQMISHSMVRHANVLEKAQRRIILS